MDKQISKEELSREELPSLRREELYSTQECEELGLSINKLKSLVRNRELKKVKSKADKRLTYYYKTEIDKLVSEEEQFYEV